MDELKLKRLLLGSILLLLGIDISVFWKSFPRYGAIGFFLVGIYMILTSEEGLKEKAKNTFPFRVENLLRFPRLPYFQTALFVLIFLASLFFISYDYIALIWVLIGLAVSHFILSSMKRNIQDESKIMLVIEFQIFLYFSTFIYVHFNRFYISGNTPDFLPSIIFMLAWIVEILRLYINHFK